MSDERKSRWPEIVPQWLQVILFAGITIYLGCLQTRQADHNKQLEVSGQLFPLAVEVLKNPPSAGEDPLRDWAVDVVSSVSRSLDFEVSKELAVQLHTEPLPPLEVLPKIYIDAPCAQSEEAPNLCRPEGANITIETSGELWVLVEPKSRLMQPVRYLIRSGPTLVIYTDWYQSGNNKRHVPIKVPGVGPGRHTLVFDAESRPGDPLLETLNTTVQISRPE